jgi:hypothetical protein
MDKIFQTILFLLLLFLVTVFLTYANEIDDLDFWWHLRAGELIYETHEIPQKDDFSYTISSISAKTKSPCRSFLSRMLNGFLITH